MTWWGCWKQRIHKGMSPDGLILRTAPFVCTARHLQARKKWNKTKILTPSHINVGDTWVASLIQNSQTSEVLQTVPFIQDMTGTPCTWNQFCITQEEADSLGNYTGGYGGISGGQGREMLTLSGGCSSSVSPLQFFFLFHLWLPHNRYNSLICSYNMFNIWSSLPHFSSCVSGWDQARNTFSQDR